MKNTLNTFIKDALKKLKDAQSNLINNKVKSISINNEYFDEKFMKTDVTDATADFKQLKTIKNPVLYWFELNSSENNVIIRGKYITYRDFTKKRNNKVEYRNTSSLKTKPDYKQKFYM